MSDPEGPYQGYAGGALFTRRCSKCGRVVKADPTITINGLEELVSEDNATCSRCGRVEMNFLGWFEEAI